MLKLNKLEDIASSLKEISSDLIRQNDGDGISSHWYQGSDDVDLFFWRDERNIVFKQQFILLGEVAEWDIITGVHTGIVIEDDKGQRMGMSSILRLDAKASQGLLLRASQIIDLASQIKEPYKTQMKDNFKSERTISKMSMEDLVFFFGLQNQKKNRFWTRLLDFLLRK